MKYNTLSTQEAMQVGRMVLSEYPNFVLMTANPQNRQGGLEKLTDNEAKRILAYTGIAGEAGEVAEFWKKYLLHGKDYDREKLKKEMGDVFWYLFLMCEMEDIPIAEVLKTNMTKLAERHLNNPDHAEHHDFYRNVLAS